MEINLKLTSIAQLLGLEAAVTLYADMEGERRKDAGVDKAGGYNKEWTPRDEERYQGAREIVKLLEGNRR